MSLLYDRVYRLEVGDNGETLTVDGGIGQRSGVQGDIAATPRGEPARIQFRVFQGASAYVTRAQISVYGLSRETRRKIYERYTKVTLTAGYRDNYGELFTGEIYNSEIVRDGPENVITMFCRAAGREWEDATVTRTFGAGTPVIEVIRGCAETYGVPIEFVGDYSDLPNLISSLPVQMGTTRIINELSRQFGFEYHFESKRVVFYRNQAQRDTVHRTSATTGMVGTPIIRQRGIDVTIKMNPQIRLRETIEVTNETGQLGFNNPDAVSRELALGTGRYAIWGFAHVGDLYGDMWDTQIEGLNPRELRNA